MPPRARSAQAAAASLLSTLPPSADPRLERELRDLGLSVELMVGVHLQDFDEEASLHNQARVGKPVDRDVVDEYAAKMRDGKIFPAIVAWNDPGKKKMMILDGNHRYQAAKQVSHSVVDAYLVDGDPMAIQIFMFSVNAQHGVATDDETRVHHALWLHDAGKPINVAARMMSVKEALVKRAYKLRDAANRAESLKIPLQKFDALHQGVRETLALFETDEVFKAMTTLAISAGLSADEVKSARKDMAGVRSIEQQLKYIEAMKDTFADRIGTQGKLERGKGSQAFTPRMRVMSTVGLINSLPEPALVLSHFTRADKDSLLPKVKEAKARLDALEEELLRT